MAGHRTPPISLRKQPKQSRSTELVTAILEAAVQVLAQEGVQRFTTGRVAEKAGVSVGSLYQYFPNKAAILFRLQSDEWQQTANLLSGILEDAQKPPFERLRTLVHAFLRSECEEAEMRVALNDAAPLYRDAPEVQEARSRGDGIVTGFMSWKRNWDDLATFFKYPDALRRLIYTTNPIESLNSRVRKTVKGKSVFPTEIALFKALYLAVTEASKRWTVRTRNWSEIMVIARAANIFGPYARFDPKRANFIPALVRKAVDKMEPFEVWGNPAVTRDVIYVDDFADAICALLTAEALPWGVFNVGSGEPTTVGQVVQWVLAGAGHRPKQITYTESGPTTIPFRLLDCSRIQEAVGWKPALTVEDGVKRTIRWWMENRNWWRK